MPENWISFPNLALTFNLNPVAFTLGSTEIKWSLIFTLIAVAAGIYLYLKAVSKQDLGKKQIAAVTAVTTFFALAGARLVFVIPDSLWLKDQVYQVTGSYPDTGYYNSFYKFIAFFDRDYSGLNLFGGLILGLIALAVICKIKKWPMAKYLDSVIYALPVSIAVNALGYITDQSSFGQHSNSLLAINGSQIQDQVYNLYQSSVLRGAAAVGPNVKWIVGNPVAPTPIYEILGCIAVMLIVCLISRFMIFTGEKFLWSLGLYSLVRALTESSRVDAVLFWNMRINVMFSIAAVLVCALLILIIRWQVREGRLRNVSRYVDPLKNDGFENDVFVQKIYRGEAADLIPGENTNDAPGETSGEADAISSTIVDAASGEISGEADAIPNTIVDAAPGETADAASEPGPSEGKGQVWTSDDAGDTDQNPDNKKQVINNTFIKEDNDGDTH